MPRYSQAPLCAGDHDRVAITFDGLNLWTYEGAARGNGSGSGSSGDANSGSTVDAAMTLVDMMRFSIESTDFTLSLLAGKGFIRLPLMSKIPRN
jgi:hypothetical protein